jgi:predicted phosphodiesterase
MRIAIISDIHANMEAFTAVLADMADCRTDEALCLGDSIGYGPEPVEVINLLLEKGIPSVLGNHEMAVRGPEHFAFFNPDARRSIQKTIALLPEHIRTVVIGLPVFLSRQGCRFVHGFPPDSCRTYLFYVETGKLPAAFSEFPESICFVGHTHRLEMVEYDGTRVFRKKLGRGFVPLDKHRRYILNIGSVGQPRDGDQTAKYAILDTLAHILEIRFVPYDIATVVDKLIKGGWPEIHAARLMA